MIIQTFKTMCDSCGEEVTHKVGDMTGSNEIIVDFMDDMEFECTNCESTFYISVEKTN